MIHCRPYRNSCLADFSQLSKGIVGRKRGPYKAPPPPLFLPTVPFYNWKISQAGFVISSKATSLLVYLLTAHAKWLVWVSGLWISVHAFCLCVCLPSQPLLSESQCTPAIFELVTQATWGTSMPSHNHRPTNKRLLWSSAHTAPHCRCHTWTFCPLMRIGTSSIVFWCFVKRIEMLIHIIRCINAIYYYFIIIIF